MQPLPETLAKIVNEGSAERLLAARHSVEGLITKFFPDSVGCSAVSNALAFLYSDQALICSGRSEIEATFFSHLSELVNAARSPSLLQNRKPVLTTGLNEDCIASIVDQWSALKLINFLLLQSIPPVRRSAIVATARDEGLSIIEWIAFHQVLGFDAFFIYSNDNTDGSLKLLELLAEHGVITLINNKVADRVSPQQKCYEHSLYFLPQLRSYEWVSYLDVDEFLLPLTPDISSLHDILNQLEAIRRQHSVSSIFLHWKWFGSGGQFEMRDGFVLDRFREARYDTHGKSISRLRDVLSMRHVHYPTLLPGCDLLDSSLMQISDIKGHSPIYAKAQINHYWNKSFEEFALKKIRGLSSQGLAGKQRDFEQFFAWDARAGQSGVEQIPIWLLDGMKKQHTVLMSLPGIDDQVNTIRSAVKSKLADLRDQYNLRELFETRGRGSLSASCSNVA